MTKHTPATPLPRNLTPVNVWGSNIPSLLLSQPAAYALNDGEVVALVLMPAYIQRAGAVAKERADYLAHAANAYPRLVEVLRAVVAQNADFEAMTEANATAMRDAHTLLRALGE